MGDRVAVMRKGVLQQGRAAAGLYDNPVNLFVGGFIEAHDELFEATVERANGGLAAVAEGQRLQISEELLADHQGLKAYEGRTVIVGVRPENLEDASLVEDAPEDARLRGRVDLTEALGSELMVHFTIEAKPAVTEDVKRLARDVGETVSEEADEDKWSTGPHSRGQGPIGAVVDTRSLHFFDPETGAGIYSDEGKELRHEQEQPYAARPCCRIPPAAARGRVRRWGRRRHRGEWRHRRRRDRRAISGNVSVMGIWTGEEQKKFQAVIDAFNEQQPWRSP